MNKIGGRRELVQIIDIRARFIKLCDMSVRFEPGLEELGASRGPGRRKFHMLG